ncbi:MAG: T9SS type A sorting domain-containing protein [Bacteroidota bacterium]|nr:T9SS type A sorting domain-containing protein [Bacteroidota bacterium]MDP4234600.1 T9SS type A sorting domain-containing protein [Bacteroidota bacterium]MDP4243801.1 T9SS type A sorting domain-containing protein [Bacteroidota bacterium]MDP4288961.1 T9SS type A sorting domain-containing protein [Bacteroidota bacterium]
MKHILLLASVCWILSDVAVAQTIDQSAAAIGQGSALHGWRQQNSGGRFQHGDRALAADEPYSYFDSKTPSHSWDIPSLWGSSIMIAVSQRITLNSNAGFVDSIRIDFSALAGDSIAVLLDPDTVIDGPFGPEHLDETVFDNTLNPYYVAVIYPSKTSGSGWISVPIPHVAVPQNFHVTVVPNPLSNGAGFSSSYSILGDSEATRARTLENTQSTYIIAANGLGYTGVIDSNVTPPGDILPIYSNLYVEAFVAAAGAAVDNTITPAKGISIFPNPSSNLLSVSLPRSLRVTGIDLLDVLGRIVLTSPEVTAIDVSHLMPGRYMAVVHTLSSEVRYPVIIQR